MPRVKHTCPTSNNFKEKLIHWSVKEEHFVLLNSNENPSKYKWLAAFGCKEKCQPANNRFHELGQFIEQHKDWAFGYFSYDLKNETEKLNSNNFDGLAFPELCFFLPKYVLVAESDEKLAIYSEGDNKEEINTLLNSIEAINIESKSVTNSINIVNRISKEEYLEKVNALKQHIQLGNIYEVNFCQEFFAEEVSVNISEVYEQLNGISKAPFSCLLKTENIQVACASPERFLKREGSQIISQPIKGTRKRGKTEEEDLLLKKELSTDEKEISENIMIVDLVRNDLSKTATRGSVKVDELCKVYSYKQVHQLISTVGSTLNENVSSIELIKNMFPMGSMTGAPKIRAMELIEEYESMKRGIYSGAIGYITPAGDFDLNVVIRSIAYNAQNKYLSFCTGGAITSECEPEKEYEESMVKAKAMFEVLQSTKTSEYA